jgi:hypothetical protein
MSEKTYDGWTNYATWRINLEIFDGTSLDDFDGIDDKVDAELVCAYTLGEALKERAEYYIECNSDKGIARDYALAFLSDVNWHEIAEHMIEDAKEEA